MAAAETSTASGVCWDLSDLYAGPDDPGIDADLDAATEQARAFAERYRGRVGELAAAELAAAVDELEALGTSTTRTGAYAGLLFAADTLTPRHGALLVAKTGRPVRFLGKKEVFDAPVVGQLAAAMGGIRTRP